MSGRMFHSSSRLLALLGVLALAAGCQMVRPKAEASGICSSLHVSQASFESDDGEPKNELGLEDFYPDKIGTTVKKMYTAAPDKKEAKKAFDEADAIFRQANALPVGDERQRLFLEAARKYLVAAERFPNSAVEQDSLYMAGESYF